MSTQKKQKMGQPTVTLNTGAKMPMLGYGTFLAESADVIQGVKWAVLAGYRHIDCAAIYGNEADVGVALKEIFDDKKTYGVERKDLFITTKLWLSDMHPDKVEEALKESLKKLQLTYVDLYLVHVPCQKEKGKKRTGFGLQDTWRAMEKLYPTLAKAIGVSNYTTLLLNDLLNYAKVPPAVNQIERHPWQPNPKHFKWCNDNGVFITSFAALGAPGLMKSNLLKDPTVNKLADKYKKSAAQVLVRWSLDSGAITLAKSIKQDRIKQNFNVLDFSLTEGEVAELGALNKEATGRLFLQEDHCSGFFW